MWSSFIFIFIFITINLIISWIQTHLLFWLFLRICPLVIGWWRRWEMWIILKLLKFSLRVLLSIWFIFRQFQPDVAYKRVAYKKAYNCNDINWFTEGIWHLIMRFCYKNLKQPDSYKLLQNGLNHIYFERTCLTNIENKLYDFGKISYEVVQGSIYRSTVFSGLRYDMLQAVTLALLLVAENSFIL